MSREHALKRGDGFSALKLKREPLCKICLERLRYMRNRRRPRRAASQYCNKFRPASCNRFADRVTVDMRLGLNGLHVLALAVHALCRCGWRPELGMHYWIRGATGRSRAIDR
jgi:hypothetical protein